MNHNNFVASFRKFIWEECSKEQGNIFVLVLISVNRHYANMNHTEITNRMQPCTRIYYSNVYQLLNMFQVTHRSSSGAQNCNCSLWFYIHLWVPAAVMAEWELIAASTHRCL